MFFLSSYASPGHLSQSQAQCLGRMAEDRLRLLFPVLSVSRNHERKHCQQSQALIQPLGLMDVYLNDPCSTALWQVGSPINKVNMGFIPCSAWPRPAPSLCLLRRLWCVLGHRFVFSSRGSCLLHPKRSAETQPLRVPTHCAGKLCCLPLFLFDSSLWNSASKFSAVWSIN